MIVQSCSEKIAETKHLFIQLVNGGGGTINLFKKVPHECTCGVQNFFKQVNGTPVYESFK